MNADVLRTYLPLYKEAAWLTVRLGVLGIVSLADEQFFHKDYEATLAETYGLDYEDSLVVEGGVVK